MSPGSKICFDFHELVEPSYSREPNCVEICTAQLSSFGCSMSVWNWIFTVCGHPHKW